MSIKISYYILKKLEIAKKQSNSVQVFICRTEILLVINQQYLLFFAAFLSSFILDSVCWEVVGVVKLWNEWCRTSNTTNVLPTDSFCLFYRLISDPTVSDLCVNSSVF